MILLNDFQRQWQQIGTDVLAATSRVGQSGWYILGKEVSEFERSLAHYWGAAHAVGVGNGMDALEISLRCLGVRPGQKVLTTPLSAYATSLAIMRIGAQPVFVDVDERGQLDLHQAKRALEADKSLRCMMPVHLYGFAGILAGLDDLMKRYDLQVVEDCAQAIGAKFQGRPVGAAGQMAGTSFYPTKNLGALGDGGAIITADVRLAEKSKTYRHYGQSATYVHQEIGLNSRLDELQAAILHQAMLPRLTDWTQRRRSIAQKYLQGIQHPAIRTLKPLEGEEPVWHLFPVLVEPALRQNLRDHLKALNIQTGVHYPMLIPDQEASRKYGLIQVIGDLAVARRFAGGEVSLPIHPQLTDQEIDLVIAACNQWQVGTR